MPRLQPSSTGCCQQTATNDRAWQHNTDKVQCTAAPFHYQACHTPQRQRGPRTQTQRGKEREKHTCNFPQKSGWGFQNCCTDLRQNALVLEKFALLTVAHKGSRHQCLPRTHVLPPINDFTSFVCLAKGAGGESCSLEHRGSRGGSKRRDTDVFCRCLLNFYESPGRTLTNQS